MLYTHHGLGTAFTAYAIYFNDDVDEDALTYLTLANRLAKQVKLLEHADIRLLGEHSEDKIIVFERAGLVFAFNFHPTQSYSDYPIMAKAGGYQMILDNDVIEFGGHGRLVPNQEHFTLTSSSQPAGQALLSIYLPNRTGIVLQPVQKDGSQSTSTE